jgi:hypothetical protein
MKKAQITTKPRILSESLLFQSANRHIYLHTIEGDIFPLLFYSKQVLDVLVNKKFEKVPHSSLKAGSPFILLFLFTETWK